MGAIRRFEDLECWITARNLSQRIFEILKSGKICEDFNLARQIRDSSGSGMDNIAEGFDRGGNREFIQFLFIAKGSIGETKSQLYRAKDRNYISQEEFDEVFDLAETACRQISGLVTYLMKSGEKGFKFK